MKKLTLLILVFIALNGTAQQYKWFDKPNKKSEAIIIYTSDTLTDALLKFKNLAIQDGYFPSENSAAQDGYFTSNMKSFKMLDQKINAVIYWDSCTKIRITAQYTGLSMNLYNVSTQGKLYNTQANGMKGSVMWKLWGDINTLATSYPNGKVYYGIPVKK